MHSVDVADVILDAAQVARVDQIWLEPAPLAEDRYLLTLEQQGSVLASTTLEGGLAVAVVARLALLAELDLALDRVQTGTVAIAGPGGQHTCVITVRPGANLRCEVVLIPARDKSEFSVSVSTDPRAELEPGVRIDHYQVCRFLGRGGMGSVYEVEHVSLGRRLALKVLHRSALMSTPDSTARFLREARAAARIAHPHIVQVFDFGHLPDGRPYIVMEMLSGESLGDHIARGALDVRRVVGIAQQTASALAAAHEYGVIHADVTPPNIMLVEARGGLDAKLVDFGLARLQEERVEGASVEVVYGTPHYISPEQIRGLEPDARSDMYSFGAVLYEALTGTPPFDAADVHALCMMHLETPPPALVIGEELPPGLAEIVRRCLAKAPADRFASMREVAAALTEVEHALDRRGWRRWLPR
jgi:serine/threonine protein kinase